MKRFIESECRTQTRLLPESINDYIADTNPMRILDVFVDELELGKLGFDGVEPAITGRPTYQPCHSLKNLYLRLP